MEKRKRTYRLSDQAIAVIEQRDPTVYSNANDFVEKMILKAGQENETDRVLQEIQLLHDDVRKILKILSEEPDFTLPDFDSI